MIEAVALVVLAGAAAAIAWFWRSARLRQLARDRLAEPEAAAPAEPERPRVFPFVRRHLWVPWGLAGLLALGLFFLAGWPTLFALSFGLIAGLLGGQLENYRVARTLLRIEEQLADSVDLMVATLRAGAGVMKALEQATVEAREPLRTQFEELLGRIRLGDDPRAVLNALEQRVPLETFRLFSSALTVHWETGGSLTPALAVVGRVIRNRIEVNRRIRALGAQARASTVAVLLLTYCVGLVMWRGNPVGVQQFLATTLGQALVGGAILLQAVGLVWSAALSRLRY